MFKTQKTRIKLIILLWVLLWLIRSIFFVKKEVFWGRNRSTNSTLQGLLNTIEQNEPIEKMFEWNAMKENIYQKALNANKTKAAKETMVSLDDLVFINNWIDIQKEDILNVLYNTNKDIRRAIKWSCKKCKISSKEIKESYRKIREALYKKEILKTSDADNNTNNKFVEIRINNQFQNVSNNQQSLQALSEAALWEDYFMNWVAEDSDYDLQLDIQNIGDLLFESFIAPVETVFYKLPPNYVWWGSLQGWWNNNSAQKQELLTLLQNLLNPSGSTNTWVITNWWGEPWATEPENQQQNTSNQTTNNQTTNNNETDIFETTDASLDNFVKQNNLTQKTTNQLQSIQWDMCREWITAEIPPKEEEKEETIDQELLEEYLEDFQAQVDTINNIYPENEFIPNVLSDIANSTTTWSTTGVNNETIQKYVDSFFDNEPAENCFNGCSTLPLDEKIICQIQCTCRTFSRSNDPDPRAKNINEMLKLRFCMVPVQNMRVSKGKDIYSFDDILTRIQSIIYNMINWWSMIKFQKTKEFLENPVADFKFSKIFSFQLNINFKPIFSNESKLAKADKKQVGIKNLDKSNNSAAGKIDRNKYVIIADPIRNNIYKWYASSMEEYEQKIEKQRQQIELKLSTAKKNETNVINNEKWVILDKIDNFLSENYKFRSEIEENLSNINSIVYSLQQKL